MEKKITGDYWNFIDPHQSSMNLNEVHGPSHVFRHFVCLEAWAEELGLSSRVSKSRFVRSKVACRVPEYWCFFGCLKLKHGWKGRSMTCNRFQVWHEKALFAVLILSSHIKLWIDKLFFFFPLEVMDRIAISSFIESWRHSATLQWGKKDHLSSMINVLAPECLENCELS